MKILLLTDAEEEHRFSEFYSGLHKQIASVELHRPTEKEQANLKAYFSQHVELSRHDRIVLGLPFTVLSRQVSFLQRLSALVFLDFYTHKDCLNRSNNTHLNFYKKLPWARVIVSNYQAAVKFHEAGLDAYCVPKGYTKTTHIAGLVDASTDYDFVQYTGRTSLTENILRQYPCLQNAHNFTNAAAADFLALTDKTAIDLFKETKVIIFPDKGIQEYQAAIFKEMSLNHLVFAYNQGDEENIPLGFQDMKNIILFSERYEIEEKRQWLAQHPDCAYRIAKAGRKLAQSEYSQYDLGIKAAKLIAKPIRNRKDFRMGLSVFGFKF